LPRQPGRAPAPNLGYEDDNGKRLSTSAVKTGLGKGEVMSEAAAGSPRAVTEAAYRDVFQAAVTARGSGGRPGHRRAVLCRDVIKKQTIYPLGSLLPSVPLFTANDECIVATNETQYHQAVRPGVRLSG
jgi:hypothetical protein